MRTTIQERIFKKIEELKSIYNLTDGDMAHILNISLPGYSRLKNLHRKLTLRYLEKMAAHFNVPLYHFFFSVDELHRYIVIEILKGSNDHKVETISTTRLQEIVEGANPSEKEFRVISSVLDPDGVQVKKVIMRLLKVTLVEIGLTDSEIDEFFHRIDNIA